MCYEYLMVFVDQLAASSSELSFRKCRRFSNLCGWTVYPCPGCERYGGGVHSFHLAYDLIVGVHWPTTATAVDAWPCRASSKTCQSSWLPLSTVS